MEKQSLHAPTITTQQEEQRNHFSEDLGRIFEIGFNTGFLTAINQHKKVKTHFGDLYKKDLSHLRIQSFLTKMYERTGVINQVDKEILRRWVLYFFQKGYLAGLNLFTEYLQSFEKQRQIMPREIVYLQCNFYGQNSLYTYDKNEKAAVQDLMQQLQSFSPSVSTLSEEEMSHHRQKGNFLNADTLLLLKYSHYWRILCIDLSVFSLQHLDEAQDLSNIENIRRMLTTELHYNRAKSVFSDMSIDTDQETFTTTLLSGELKDYFLAFKRKDKETVKLIQAASYAYDFYHFLLRKNILTPQNTVLFNVIGYTDRAVNALSVKHQQLSVLETCADIYKAPLLEKDIGQARDTVLRRIQSAARKGFGGQREFVQNLIHLVDNGDGTQWLEHTETIEHFLNTRTPLTAQNLSPTLQKELPPAAYQQKHILDVHALLTSKELAGLSPYLFLTGNPGIGKTTAVVNFLKRARQQGEGFFFLYISPRKHVNLDIINKFREDTGEPACPDVFALTTNSIIIRNNADQKTVHYYSDLRQDTFREQNVTFIHADSDEAKRQQVRARRLEEIQEGLLIDKGERVSGVLV